MVGMGSGSKWVDFEMSHFLVWLEMGLDGLSLPSKK
jgi:hypothetical protein